MLVFRAFVLRRKNVVSLHLPHHRQTVYAVLALCLGHGAGFDYFLRLLRNGVFLFVGTFAVIFNFIRHIFTVPFRKAYIVFSMPLQNGIMRHDKIIVAYIISNLY